VRWWLSATAPEWANRTKPISELNQTVPNGRDWKQGLSLPSFVDSTSAQSTVLDISRKWANGAWLSMHIYYRGADMTQDFRIL